MRILLPAGTEFYRRKDQGRYLYVQECDGPLLVEINGERHILSRGKGVNVPEGFSQVHYSNLHGVDQWIELDISSHIFIDNQLAGEVDIGQWNAGVLPVDPREGKITTAAAQEIASESDNFIVHKTSAIITASYYDYVGFSFNAASANAEFPKKIIIEKIRWYCDQPAELVVQHHTGDNVSIHTIGAATPINEFFQPEGFFGEIFPIAANTADRKWIRSPLVGFGGNKGERVDHCLSPDGNYKEWKPEVPVVIGQPKIATSGYSYRYIGVHHIDGGVPADWSCNIQVFGKVIA